MLEICGLYTPNNTSDVLKVLVQFEGGVLHVWRQSDPFCLLLSCSDFSISSSVHNHTGNIRLRQRGRIETSDLENLKRLQENLQVIERRKIYSFLKSRETIIVVAMLFLFYVIWFFTKHGL